MMDLFEIPRCIPSSPKDMKVLSIGVDQAMQYNELWHSRLPKTQKGNLTRNKHFIFYGAEFKDHCFASAIWTTPVANNRLSENEIWLELRRLAVAPDAPKFTATWMIAKMIKAIKIKHPEITKLISYQDTDVHTGTIYAASNWIKEGQSKGVDWNVTRDRKASQSTSDKVRWTYRLKPSIKKIVVGKQIYQELFA
jgi:hypothetical protein